MNTQRDTSPQQPLERPYAVYENYEGGLQIIDKQGRIVLDDVYAYDKDREARDARMDALVDALNQSAPSAIERPCATCNDDPAVCANVPGLRHCEKAIRGEDEVVPSGAGAADYEHLRAYILQCPLTYEDAYATIKHLQAALHTPVAAEEGKT